MKCAQNDLPVTLAKCFPTKKEWFTRFQISEVGSRNEAQPSVFAQDQEIWKSVEAPFWVFNIASQTINVEIQLYRIEKSTRVN